MTQPSWRSIIRILVKTALLFALANGLFAMLKPLSFMGQISLYNGIVPGRARLPYGESAASNNLSLNSLEAMFASHEIARPKARDEYRVLVIGDSSVWGVLLKPDETLAGNLNAAGYQSVDGRTMRFYNVGYPEMSLTKDLMLLDYAMQYQPDMVLWMMTLRSFPPQEQLEPNLVKHNADRVRALIQQYDLRLNPDDPRFVETDWVGETIIGRRRDIADWLRLQLYGIAWATTGVDIVIGDYTPRSNDFEADESWYAETPETLADALMFDVLDAGAERIGEVPFLMVNEPIFIADGDNSDLRYNFWYPRWTYDLYRGLLAEKAIREGWEFIDLWDLIDPAEFTDSPVHMTPKASHELAEAVGREILNPGLTGSGNN